MADVVLPQVISLPAASSTMLPENFFPLSFELTVSAEWTASHEGDGYGTALAVGSISREATTLAGNILNDAMRQRTRTAPGLVLRGTGRKAGNVHRRTFRRSGTASVPSE